MYRLKFEELFPAKNVESKPIFLSCLVWLKNGNLLLISIQVVRTLKMSIDSKITFL